MLSILIAEDNAQVRTALRVCLELTPLWRICGEAENGQDAIDLADRLKPDVILLDYAMPVMNGIEAARHISVNLPDCVLILFTMFASNQLKSLAKAAGISEVVSKDVGGIRALVEAIKRFSAAA